MWIAVTIQKRPIYLLVQGSLSNILPLDSVTIRQTRHIPKRPGDVLYCAPMSLAPSFSFQKETQKKDPESNASTPVSPRGEMGK